MTDKSDINFIKFLKSRLAEPLPGIKAHIEMAVTKDGQLYRRFEPEVEPFESAVLVLLTNVDNILNVLLTLRSSKLNNHSGQISCPGGRKERGETPVQTALRETFEELGIMADKIEILGMLSNLYVPPSNNMITPIVGYIVSIDDLLINTDEVEETFTIEVRYLADEYNIRRNIWRLGKNNEEVTVPHWDLNKRVALWGATAMILNELIYLYREYKRGIGNDA